MGACVISLLAALALVPLIATLFWRVRRADLAVCRLRVDLAVLRQRMRALEQQIGWDGDRAFTVALPGRFT